MRIGDEQFVQDIGSIFHHIQGGFYRIDGETDESFEQYKYHYNYRCFNAFFLGVKYGLRDVMTFDIEAGAYKHWKDNEKYYRMQGVYKAAFPRFIKYKDLS